MTQDFAPPRLARELDPAALVPRLMCARCGRPRVVCLCAHIAPIRTRTRVLILQHPRESAVPIGTARLAELGLINSERLVGVDFENDRELSRALPDSGPPPILLYPGAKARDLAELPPSKPVTLVVIDGTWSQAEKILKTNPRLASMPRYALNPEAPSRYRIRRAPSAHCISTIEAIVQALLTLEGPESPVRAALAPFDAMVEQQLTFKRERAERRHTKRKRPARPRATPKLLSERARDLVVAYGEANAWPRNSPLGGKGELVHWAAERLLTGERFSAFIAPEQPLSPTFTAHTAISASRVLTGESRAAFQARWQRFLGPSALLCVWGHFASEILRAGGGALPEVLDIRTAARNYLRRSPGQVEESACALAQPPEPPWADGRTGVRLAGLTAVTRALLTRASSGTASPACAP